MSGWRVAAAAVAGGGHVRAAAGCQDAFAVRAMDDLLVVAVADGGSRASLAGVGANAVVALASRIVCDRLAAGTPTDGAGWHACVADVLSVVIARFGGYANRTSEALLGGADAGALGTTLTVLVAGAPWVAVGAIGDGFVVVRRGASHLDLLLPPDDDVPPDPRQPLGRTVFVTSARAGDRARRLVARLPDLTGLAVSTDGLSELGLRYERSVAQHPHPPFFTPLFDRMDTEQDMALQRLLASPKVGALTSDDTTLVLAVPA